MISLEPAPPLSSEPWKPVEHFGCRRRTNREEKRHARWSHRIRPDSRAALCWCLPVVLRAPQCRACLMPLQPVEETVRDLGIHGVETVTHYECSNCYRAMRRRFILSHLA